MSIPALITPVAGRSIYAPSFSAGDVIDNRHDNRRWDNSVHGSYNQSSPNLGLYGGSLGGGLVPYGGYGGLTPYSYPYVGYGGSMIPYGGMSPYMLDPWDYYDPYEYDDPLGPGYINAPHYNNIILMDGPRRRRSLLPCFRRRRDPYMRMLMMRGGLGVGRRGWMSEAGLLGY